MRSMAVVFEARRDTRCSGRTRSTARHPTKATCTCWKLSRTTRRKNGGFGRSGRRRYPLLLLDDGAGRGRVGPRHARDDRAPGRKPLGHQRPGSGSSPATGARSSTSSWRGPPIAIDRGRGADDVPGGQRRSRHRGDTPAGNPGIELRRRALRATIQRAAGDRRPGARGNRRGLSLRPGAARSGTAHPLHALARCREGAHTTSRCGYAVRREAFGKPLARA